MATHQDARTAADVRARMANRAAHQAALRAKAEKLFRDEPELTASAIAERLNLTKSAVANWRREWKREGGR